MEDQLISFETAKLAKEKGFNISTDNYFRISINPEKEVSEAISDSQTYFPNVKESYSAPTQSLLQKWLREKYDIHISVYRLNERWCSQLFSISKHVYITKHRLFNTYEEALEKGLQEALKLIDNETNRETN